MFGAAVKVPLDAITDRLRESEDADYCAAVIERLKAVIAEFEPPAKTANKTAKPPRFLNPPVYFASSASVASAACDAAELPFGSAAATRTIAKALGTILAPARVRGCSKGKSATTPSAKATAPANSAGRG